MDLRMLGYDCISPPFSSQAQLHENEGLRRQLASESQRAAVLEARMGALGSPAEISGALVHSQVCRGRVVRSNVSRNCLICTIACGPVHP